MLTEISKMQFDSANGILPRRYGLKDGKYFLYGAPGSGKTSLALLYGVQYKKALYVDCADSRFCLQTAKTQILKLYLERDLTLLIIDNYTTDLPLPNMDNIILIAPSLVSCPPNFKPKLIRALSFEEYVSFDAKNMSINHLFNCFIKDGNLPEMIKLPIHSKIKRKQEMLKIALWQDFVLFSSLLKMQGQAFSTHHIFTLLKKTHKLSKDRIYPLLHSLEERGIVHFVPYGGTKSNANKKLYFYDFALPLCVLNERHLNALLENMLLLEIFSLYDRYHIDKLVYYGDMGEFISVFGVFIFLPFATKEQILHKRVQMKQYDFVYFITFSFKQISKDWEALSFENFALEFIPHF